MKDFQWVVERYCPVLGRNVAMEVGVDKSEVCLQEHHCKKEFGGCTNGLTRRQPDAQAPGEQG